MRRAAKGSEGQRRRQKRFLGRIKGRTTAAIQSTTGHFGTLPPSRDSKKKLANVSREGSAKVIISPPCTVDWGFIRAILVHTHATCTHAHTHATYTDMRTLLTLTYSHAHVTQTTLHTTLTHQPHVNHTTHQHHKSLVTTEYPHTHSHHTSHPHPY